MTGATRLVILDRDGVINEDSDAFVKSADEFLLIDGSAEAIARLSQAGFLIAIATNQSGLARGYFGETELNAMHAKLQQAVATAGGRIDTIVYCPHGPDDNCDCRKPKAGLLEQIEAQLGVSAAGAPVVGDSLRDLQAGVSKACQPLLVLTGKGAKTQRQLQENAYPGLENVPVFDDLSQASLYILDHYLDLNLDHSLDHQE